MRTENATVNQENSQIESKLDLTHLSDKRNVRPMTDAPLAVKGKAKAILIKIPGWKCSRCGAEVPARGGRKEPPRRCPNRKTCGALFHRG